MTREEAIKVLERISEDTIQRDCSTCARITAGTYIGVCCYCSLCKVVPEMFKDYHERKHFRSYWTWDGKRKNEALEMAISALRQQEHFREVTKKVEPLTLDDAIAHLDDTLSDTGRKWSCESCRMEHVQLREWLAELRYIKRKRNAPLTLDELRQMDGEDEK